MTNTTDRLRECVTKGGRGSKKVENLRDVIYGWSLVTYGLFECQLFPTHTLNDEPFPLDLFSKPSLLLTKKLDAPSPVGVLVLPVAM